MLYVIFTEIADDRIKTFDKIPLAEANHLTENLEQSYRKDKKKATGEFYIVDLESESDKKEALYRGSFKFGSYEAPNIYQHIKKTLPSIKVSREQEHEKVLFLEKLEDETEFRYKVEENIDLDLAGLDKRRISSLGKVQRRMIYGIAVVATLMLISSFLLYNTKTNSYKDMIVKSQNEVKQQRELIAVYEKGLNGDDNAIVEYFIESDKITDEQKLMLANILIKDKKFKEVVEIYDDIPFVANLVSNSKQATLQDTINTLKEFDALYPTNQAKYDLAYYSGRYDLMLKIPEVQMNARRSRMKTYAHLKMGELEEAKVELANNNNEKLKTQINSYELLQAEIELLEEKIDVATKAYEDTSELDTELKEKKDELESI